MVRIVERANMQKAWKRVKSNKGAPGVDGMSVDAFPAFAREQWNTIRQSLLDGTYQPQPVRRVSIPKSGGGERMLGIPTVIDRVIQQAVLQILTPIFDPHFSESSFGYRPGRSAHGALRRVKGFVGEGCRVAVDIDLAKFFDTVNHDLLMGRISRRVRDKTLLALIGRYLRAGVLEGTSRLSTDIGTPQGGPLSPLLANILLDDLDRELEKRGHRFARYADDLIILVGSKRAGERVMDSITRFLTTRLKLRVNTQKSRVVSTKRSSFLGFRFVGAKLCWTQKSFAQFKYTIRRLTGRSWGVSMEYRYKKLAQYLRGWMGYYGIAECYSYVRNIDGWIRRRIRMCYWKQWRRPRTKVRHLLSLGTDKHEAIKTAISSKGYWRLSRTLATQTGMTNHWLEQQGLVSAEMLWQQAQLRHRRALCAPLL